MKQMSFWRHFLTHHGLIFLFGVGMVLVLGVFVSVYYLIDPEFVHKISAMIVTNIAVGRVPSISLGYASDLGHFWVMGTNIYIEMIMVTLLYSIFIFSYHNMVSVSFLDKFFHAIHEYRERYSTFFDKWGLVGLFVFVFIPFWMTGPIVGAIIGYLIGLGHFTIMITVFVATVFAIAAWGLLLHQLVGIFNAIDSSLIWIVLGIVVFSGVAWKLYKKWKH